MLEEASDDVVVLGGDHPWTPADRGIPYEMAELDALDLPQDTKQKIERGNALKLLGPRARLK